MTCEYWKWRDQAEAQGRFDAADTRTWDTQWMREAPQPCRQCARCVARARNSTEPLRPPKPRR